MEFGFGDETAVEAEFLNTAATIQKTNSPVEEGWYEDMAQQILDDALQHPFNYIDQESVDSQSQIDFGLEQPQFFQGHESFMPCYQNEAFSLQPQLQTFNEVPEENMAVNPFLHEVAGDGHIAQQPTFATDIVAAPTSTPAVANVAFSYLPTPPADSAVLHDCFTATTDVASQYSFPAAIYAAYPYFLPTATDAVYQYFLPATNGACQDYPAAATDTVGQHDFIAAPDAASPNSLAMVTQQKSPTRRGRPRKHPLPDPNAPKRGRGRPKGSIDTYSRLARGEKAAMNRAARLDIIIVRKAQRQAQQTPPPKEM